MKANNIEELIKALRCSATVRKKDASCEGCPYRGLEEVKDSLPPRADLMVDGKEYWQYCDTEQMAKDSADMLEKLAGRIEEEHE